MGSFRAMPYAKALEDVVLERAPEQIERIGEELDAFARGLGDVPELERLFAAPTLSPDDKSALLDQITAALGFAELSRQFLRVVQRHYRLPKMAEIAAAFRQLADRRAGRVRATIQVAGEPDHEVRRQLVEALAAAVGAEVVAEFEHNPELLAGFRAKVGSKVFDGSLVAELRQLQRETVRQVQR